VRVGELNRVERQGRPIELRIFQQVRGEVAVRIEEESQGIDLAGDVVEAIHKEVRPSRRVPADFVPHHPREDAGMVSVPQDGPGPLAAVGVPGGFWIGPRFDVHPPLVELGGGADEKPGNQAVPFDGELRGRHHAQLVARVVVFRRHDRAVMTHVVETVRLDDPQPFPVQLLV
jgi:hypothetical protein